MYGQLPCPYLSAGGVRSAILFKEFEEFNKGGGDVRGSIIVSKVVLLPPFFLSIIIVII